MNEPVRSATGPGRRFSPRSDFHHGSWSFSIPVEKAHPGCGRPHRGSAGISPVQPEAASGRTRCFTTPQLLPSTAVGMGSSDSPGPRLLHVGFRRRGIGRPRLSGFPPSTVVIRRSGMLPGVPSSLLPSSQPLASVAVSHACFNEPSVSNSTRTIAALSLLSPARGGAGAVISGVDQVAARLRIAVVKAQQQLAVGQGHRRRHHVRLDADLRARRVVVGNQERRPRRPGWLRSSCSITDSSPSFFVCVMVQPPRSFAEDPRLYSSIHSSALEDSLPIHISSLNTTSPGFTGGKSRAESGGAQQKGQEQAGAPGERARAVFMSQSPFGVKVSDSLRIG